MVETKETEEVRNVNIGGSRKLVYGGSKSRVFEAGEKMPVTSGANMGRESGSSIIFRELCTSSRMICEQSVGPDLVLHES